MKTSQQITKLTVQRIKVNFVGPDKVKVMLEQLTTSNIHEVRRVVGTSSRYRRFIPDFSTIRAPISGLLRNSRSFTWIPDCDSFRRLKECLVSAPIRSYPDYTKPFMVQTDSSEYGLGAILNQPHESEDKVICYLSRSLTPQEELFYNGEKVSLCYRVFKALLRVGALYGEHRSF